MEIIIPSLITGGLGLVGVIITNLVAISSNNKKLTSTITAENTKMVNDLKLEVTRSQAITDTKIEELTREVNRHNNFAQRMPKLEEKIASINEKIDYLHSNKM